MVVLDELAEVCHELADAHTRAELPLLVRAVGGLDDPDGFDVGVLALEGQHPGSALLGFTAPEECTALGVVTTGWSLPPERFAEHDTARNRRAGSPAAEAPDRVAVFSTVVVDRGGDVAGRLSIDGAEPVTSAPESGVLLDLLLRALGCPTPSPAFGVLELLATVWLAELTSPSVRSMEWPEVADRHWGLRLRPDQAADDLVVAAVEAAAELGWDGLRLVVARMGWPGVCTGEEAAWFDAGSFARWVLGSFPPLPDLADAVTGSLRPSVARRVRSALDVWGLPA
ncbi:MAG: hypothetical protein JWN29_1753 [Acidimicrobiales bacterium]|nr:hypothetical protein [Acidimicrobiales bacterium]